MNHTLRFACLALSFGSATGLLVAGDRDWSAYLGDAGATHYSTLRGIDTKNVAQLQRAWEFHTGDANNTSQIQCNPLIIDGVLYGTSPRVKLFALDAATGVEKWSFVPPSNVTADFPNGDPSLPALNGGPSRGVAMWREGNERRLMFSIGHFLYAINPDTGKPIEGFGANGWIDLAKDMDRDVTNLFMVGTTPGSIYKDTIIVPVRVGEGPGPTAVGHVRAFDVRTGKRRWIFHTLPQPGEFGHDTWPADAWKTSGGVNNWPGLVIDHERGLAFMPTGSAAYDFYGADRVGTNLFANCIICLDANTGERKWHFQFVHHDIWDRDPPAPPVLCEVTRDGKKIPAVAQTLKSGDVWVFNRETGESLFPWKEVPVPQTTVPGEATWPTQPKASKPAPFARQRFTEDEITNRTQAAHDFVLQKLRLFTPHGGQYDPLSLRGTVMMPGTDGGGEWGGPAVDPKGILYVNASEMAYTFTMVETSLYSAGAMQVYAGLCLGCHGPKMEGNPAASIPSLVNLGAKLKTADVVALLGTGKGVMPSFNFLPATTRTELANLLIPPPAENADAPRDASTPATAPVAAGRGAGRGAPRPPQSPYISTGYLRFLDQDGYPAIKPPWGTLNAIDLNTGEYLWKVPLGGMPPMRAAGGRGGVGGGGAGGAIADSAAAPRPAGTENYGGPVVTAGGVVFIAATTDEKFRAFSASTGQLLWETSLPAAGFATPATYEVNGKQYVVIACGGGKQGNKSGDSYVAFALPETR